MLRVIFDTNIYGYLLKEKDQKEIVNKIKNNKSFIVYGFKPIRNELRNIPKVTKLSKQTRVSLLGLYDEISGKHFLQHSAKINHLALKYYNAYRNFGGIYNWNTNIQIDFMIVACASFHGLDVIYSRDQKTLCGKKAIKAYEHINAKEDFRTPYFYGYELLLKKFRGLL